jgi:2-dehydropantoate 2-reductase
MTQPFSKVAVMGAGAVGSYFGAMLARAGHAVTLIGRPAHVEAITRDGLRIESAQFTEQVRLAASSDPAAVRGAALVLLCVKSTDTEQVAQQIAGHLDAGAVVLSLQNGVDNAERIARHIAQVIVPAVVYVATAMPEPGRIQHFGRGDLVIGALRGARHDEATLAQTLRDIVDFFATAQVPVRISPDVAGELWTKLMVNCAYNAISGLAQAPYAKLAAQESIRAVMRDVVQEVIAVAAAQGVSMSLPDALAAVDKIAQAMPGQQSSTAQDMARHKPTEIEHLNGFIARKGQELGVATPVNRTLHALVKLVEAGYTAA